MTFGVEKGAKPILSLREGAELLRIDHRLLYRMLLRGAVPQRCYFRSGRSWWLLREPLLAWVRGEAARTRLQFVGRKDS